MQPEIPTASVVFVRGADSFSVNDVIVFPSPAKRDQTIIHRIISERSEDGKTLFITQGDNNNAPDNWEIREENVLGKVVLTLPWMGNLVNFMKTPLGFGIVLGIPAIIFIILQIKKIKDGINDEIEKRTKAEQSKASVGDSTKTVEKISAILLLTLLTILLLSPSTSFALFSSKAQVTGMSIRTADSFEPEFEWDGGLLVYNKTINELLNLEPFYAESDLYVNIAFVPETLHPLAHHFTIIMKKMDTDQMVHYRTMLSRWTMENYRQDGHLGYTVWQTGEYWLQVNAYSADGTPIGSYHAILNVLLPQTESISETPSTDTDNTIETPPSTDTPELDMPKVIIEPEPVIEVETPATENEEDQIVEPSVSVLE